MGCLHCLQVVAADDDPSAEEYGDYRRRLGRWRKDAVRGILNPLFWLALQLMHKSRAPLSHHFAFVRLSNKRDVLQELVCGKAESIASEWSQLANSDAKTWAGAIRIALEDLDEGLPGGARLSDVLELGVNLIFHYHAAYQRRIVTDTQRLPLALFWFGHAPADTPCHRRQVLAQRILNTHPSKLESNTAKLRQLCEGDFEQCAQDGTVGPLLYSVVGSWKRVARSDVARNEGHNSLIKSINNRCRNIGLPLLSARSNAKKELGVGVRGAPQKWRQVKLDALAMIQVWKCGLVACGR